MKLKLTILFSLLTSFCFSHQDYRASLNNENIHIEYKTGWVDFEINNKFKILSELSHRLIEKSNTNNIPIYLSFVHDYTAVDEPYFTVGYGDFSYLEYSDTSSVIHNDNGLIIKMRGHDINIKEILNVINNSVKNINYVIGDLNQYKFESMYRGEVLIESIPIDSVMAFSNSTSPLVDEILDIKIYRNIDPVSRPRSIDYYFRNNSFHFYNTREPQKEWNPETKKREVSNFFGDVILTVQNVTEIFGDFNSGHFVFTNDSTFYYIPQLKDKVYGPITIEGIQGGRRPIRKHLVDHEPIKRFILYLDNHSSGQKVLYIPDSAIVISNFDQIENDFISDLIENTEDIDKKEEKKSNRGLVFGLLIISLMINFVLLVKKNNKSS